MRCIIWMHYVNAWLKRCVFNLDLNRESVSEPRTLSGRLFQSLGAKYECFRCITGSIWRTFTRHSLYFGQYLGPNLWDSLRGLIWVYSNSTQILGLLENACFDLCVLLFQHVNVNFPWHRTNNTFDKRTNNWFKHNFKNYSSYSCEYAIIFLFKMLFYYIYSQFI